MGDSWRCSPAAAFSRLAGDGDEQLFEDSAAFLVHHDVAELVKERPVEAVHPHPERQMLRGKVEEETWRVPAALDAFPKLQV